MFYQNQKETVFFFFNKKIDFLNQQEKNKTKNPNLRLPLPDKTTAKLRLTERIKR